MNLKCKDVGCNNVYKVIVSGNGCGYIDLVVVGWKCTVCGRWNFYIRRVLDDVEVSV